MISKDNYRIKIHELLFDLRIDHNVQLLVFRDGRNDLPHLTVNWGNPSKNIKLHLTVNLKDGGKDYKQLAPISESSLSDLFVSLGQELMNRVNDLVTRGRLVRPSWLRRRGYKVFFLDDEAETQLVRKLTPNRTHGKSKKRTHILDTVLISNLHRSSEVADNYYHPRVLHELSARAYNKPVFAECWYGRQRGCLMTLILSPRITGAPYWFSFDLELIEESLKKSVDPLLPKIKELLPPDTRREIYDALRLDEIGW